VHESGGGAGERKQARGQGRGRGRGRTAERRHEGDALVGAHVGAVFERRVLQRCEHVQRQQLRLRPHAPRVSTCPPLPPPQGVESFRRRWRSTKFVRPKRSVRPKRPGRGRTCSGTGVLFMMRCARSDVTHALWMRERASISFVASACGAAAVSFDVMSALKSGRTSGARRGLRFAPQQARTRLRYHGAGRHAHVHGNLCSQPGRGPVRRRSL
jgi:hypothetical protein